MGIMFPVMGMWFHVEQVGRGGVRVTTSGTARRGSIRITTPDVVDLVDWFADRFGMQGSGRRSRAAERLMVRGAEAFGYPVLLGAADCEDVGTGCGAKPGAYGCPDPVPCGTESGGMNGSTAAPSSQAASLAGSSSVDDHGPDSGGGNAEAVGHGAHREEGHNVGGGGA